MGDRSAAQYVEVNDTEVKIVNKGLLDYTRRLVAVIGPTGAGKSTMCNTLYHIAFGTKSSFFEPSSQPQSFTKGLWLLSPEARAQLSADLQWEVVDMEGFQADQMSSWKMAMVLSVLAEIVIFCNRDARCDNIFKAATVFEKGRKLSKQLGMKPVTSMVFVQVEEGIEPELLEEVLTRVRSMIPDMKVIPFEIPQLRNKNKKDHAFITFHQELVEAVNTNLVKKFVFDEEMDAASSKSRAVAELLDAFNQGNYLKCKDLNAELLKADLERIYEAAVAVFRNVHVTKALNTQLTSTETTLEQFMGTVEPFAPDYKKSSFYVVGKSDKFVEDFASLQPAVDCKQIYQNFYKDKMEELVERLQREKLIHEQKEIDFHQDVQRCIEAARNGLLRHVSTLTFGQSLTKPQDEFLEAKKSLEERAKAFHTKPDFAPFYKFYADQGAAVKGMWDAQVNKAKWKAPVTCQGKLKCKAGHKINEDMICCINQLKTPNKDGSTVCGGRWYWIDGPTRHAMCRGTCGAVQKMPTNLTCFKCGEETICEIRPSVYYP